MTTNDKPTIPEPFGAEPLEKVAEDIVEGLDALKRAYAERAQEAGYAHDVFERFVADLPALGTSTRQELRGPIEAFRGIVTSRHNVTISSPCNVASAAFACVGTAAAYANTVAYSAVVSMPAPPPLWSEGQKRCADKLTSLHPALGKEFMNVWESFYGTVSGGERSSLYAMRQVFDHFLDVLAPPDTAPKSSDGKKATRIVRLEWAAQNHIRDEATRTSLLADLDNIRKTYDLLCKAHEREFIDRTRAKEALEAMSAILQAWLDAVDCRVLIRNWTSPGFVDT